MTAPWYKCFPRDFNDGMMGLTLEERGVYVTILNEIYARGGPLPEQDWVITSKLGCTKRTWVKVRAALILKGKLYAVNYNGVDCLMNERAAEEIADREKLSESCAERGAKGGRNSGKKRSKNSTSEKQELQSAEAEPKRYQTSEADTEIPPDEPDGSSPPKGAEKRGSRLPEDWRPDQDGIDYAAQTLPLNIDPERELDRFRDYWRAVPGAKGRKLDWPATWRNWCRNAAERSPNLRNVHERPHADAKFTRRQANHAAAYEGALRAAGREWEP